MSQALIDYKADYVMLASFEAEHADILSRHKYWQAQLAESEAVLKAHSRTNGAEDDDMFVIHVNAPPKKRLWDAAKLIKLLPWIENPPGIIIKTVDDKALLRQLKASQVDEATVAEALTVTEGTPAVLIRLKTPEPAKAEVA